MMELPIKKDTRKPNTSAATPPINGPKESPINVEEESSPNVEDILCRGVPAATRVAAAVMVPVNKPWAIRRKNTVCTFLARAMQPTIIVPKIIARRIISFLPNLSDKIPHIGAMTPIARLGTALSNPTHKRSLLSADTPSC